MDDLTGALGGAAPHLLLDELGDAVVAADESGTILYANRAAEQMLGWDRSQLVGSPLIMLVPEALRDAHRAGFQRYLDTREPQLIGAAVTVPALHADGTEHEIELTLNAVPIGERVVFVAALRDLSDRREAIRQRNLAGYLRAVADLAVALGLSGEVRTFDEAAPVVLRMLGESLDWQAGDVWLVQPDGSVKCVSTWSSAPELEGFTNASIGLEFERGEGLPGAVAESGEPIWLADATTDSNFPRAAKARELGLHGAFGFPITGGGQVIGVIGFLTTDVVTPDHDLIEVMTVVGRALGEFLVRERAEAAARFRAALLAAEAEAIIDGIVVVGLDGNLLSWNERFVHMTGVSPAELRDEGLQALLKVADALVVESDDLVKLAMDLTRDPDRVIRREFTFRDGRIIDLYSSPLRDGTLDYGRGFYLRDISEQKRSEQRYASLARTLQASLLPPTDPELPGLDVAARYSPAEADIDVGGDFYDIFPFSGALQGFAIGDVCGRGADAASLTALARYTLRAVAPTVKGGNPSTILGILNETVLRDDLRDRFLTVLLGHARVQQQGSATIRFACGGHPRPIVLRANGSTAWVGRSGTLIGVFEEAAFRNVTVRLRPGDALVCFTDGVTEARSPDGRMLNETGLEAALAGHAGLSADQIADLVLDTVRATIEGESTDDVAVLVLRMPG